MAGKKGMKHYPEELKERVRLEYEAGESMHALSRKYGVSRYSVESWCGKRPEVNIRQAPVKDKTDSGGVPESVLRLIAFQLLFCAVRTKWSGSVCQSGRRFFMFPR